MAPKPKKMSDTDKAYLKRLLKDVKERTGAGPNGSLSMDQSMALSALKRQQKQATAYSPAPMSMRAMDKAVRAGKATGAKTKPKSTAVKVAGVAGKVAGKVAGRAKTTAREARDVVTAVGTAAKAVAGSKGKQEQYGTSAGFKGAKKRNIGSALKNVGKQIKETGKAAATGKKGTTSDKFIPMSERSKTAKYQDTVLYRSGKKRK